MTRHCQANMRHWPKVVLKLGQLAQNWRNVGSVLPPVLSFHRVYRPTLPSCSGPEPHPGACRLSAQNLESGAWSRGHDPSTAAHPSAAAAYPLTLTVCWTITGPKSGSPLTATHPMIRPMKKNLELLLQRLLKKSNIYRLWSRFGEPCKSCYLWQFHIYFQRKMKFL